MTHIEWIRSVAASVVPTSAAYLMLLSICLCLFTKIQLQFSQFFSTLAVRDGTSCLRFQTLSKTKVSAKWLHAVVKANYGYFKESKIDFFFFFLGSIHNDDDDDEKEELHIVPKHLMTPVLFLLLFTSFHLLSFSVSLDTSYIYMYSFSRSFYPK